MKNRNANDLEHDELLPILNDWHAIVRDTFGPELSDQRREEIVNYCVLGQRPSEFVWQMFRLELRLALPQAKNEDFSLVPRYIHFIWEAAPGECFGKYIDNNPWEGLTV